MTDNKQEKPAQTPKSGKAISYFLYAAFIFEAVNLIVSWKLGSIQASQCLSDQEPQIASWVFFILSLLSVVLAAILARKITTILYALFWVAVTGFLQYYVLYMATGGIKFCNFVF